MQGCWVAFNSRINETMLSDIGHVGTLLMVLQKHREHLCKKCLMNDLFLYNCRYVWTHAWIFFCSKNRQKHIHLIIYLDFICVFLMVVCTVLSFLSALFSGRARRIFL